MHTYKATKDKEIAERILKVLGSLDRIIADKWRSEPHGLLSGSAGSSLYFMQRYLQNDEASYIDHSLEVLEKEIIGTNQNGVENHEDIGYHSSSFCWLIDQFVKSNVLDESEKSNSREWAQLIIKSITPEEFSANQHDLFCGFIGKAIIVIEHDRELALPFAARIIGALENNAVNDHGKIHWKTPYPFHETTNCEKTINFGIPHGSCGIILFLLKCCCVYNLHSELKPLLRGGIDWIVNELEKGNNKLLYSYSSKPSGSGKLGWCYGDQSIAFTLLRYHETFSCEKSKIKAYELIEQSALKPMDQTGVQYYPQYGYYDMRVCHGTSSVAYMYKKLYDITNDTHLNTLANKWLSITLENLDIYLPQIDDITEKEKNNPHVDTSTGFLNGLSGIGLVLMSFMDSKANCWDKLLLLDRPGRE